MYIKAAVPLSRFVNFDSFILKSPYQNKKGIVIAIPFLFGNNQYSTSFTGPRSPEGVMGIQWEKGSLTLPTRVLATSTVMVFSPFLRR